MSNVQFKQEDGFSLLEMVFSIAILALLSAFILQMFVVSSNANQRAHDIDIASSIASSAVEELKACNYENDLFQSDFVVNTQASFGLSNYFVIAEKMGFSAFDFTKGFNLYKYYDKEWNTIALTEEEAEPELPSDPKVRFILHLSATPAQDAAGGILGGQFYNVSARAYSINADKEIRELALYDTSKYFADAGEIYGY